MKLSKEEGIKPGIYRTIFSHMRGVPGIREPRFDESIPHLLEELAEEDELFDPNFKLPEEGAKRGYWPKRTFFKSIKEFMDTWKKGYELGVSQFGTNRIYNKLGFELFYVNWKPGSEFFSFGDHEGISMVGSRADLNPIMILGDNNGMNDPSGYINLGVNDFRTQKVLVFRGEHEKIDLTSKIKKPLRDDFCYYGRSGPDRFPFRSPNNLKSFQNMWTAVGINPLEVYQEIENMGFVFPE
jgi:hypothetical protein